MEDAPSLCWVLNTLRNYPGAPELPLERANAPSTVTLGDLLPLAPVPREVLLFNYMVDVEWLYSTACPVLQMCPVTIFHDKRSPVPPESYRVFPQTVAVAPQVDMSGTHHTKAILAFYEAHVRVVICTGNFIQRDWDFKSEGVYHRDFPLKAASNMPASEFENDLVEYFAATLAAVRVPATDPGRPRLEDLVGRLPGLLRRFDYRKAGCTLVGTVPGKHKGGDMRRWGHLKLRRALAEHQGQFEGNTVMIQISSIGEIETKGGKGVHRELSATFATGSKMLGVPQTRVVFPTVEMVASSIEGYRGGGSVPVRRKSVDQAFVRNNLHVYTTETDAGAWCGVAQQRSRAVPHIKTVARVRGDGVSLDWAFLGSNNLSKAAWGRLELNGSQLAIPSFELGVLFVHRDGDLCTSAAGPEAQGMRVCPLPYSLPLTKYSDGDIPWSVDLDPEQLERTARDRLG